MTVWICVQDWGPSGPMSSTGGTGSVFRSVAEREVATNDQVVATPTIRVSTPRARERDRRERTRRRSDSAIGNRINRLRPGPPVSRPFRSGIVVTHRSSR